MCTTQSTASSAHQEGVGLQLPTLSYLTTTLSPQFGVQLPQASVAKEWRHQQSVFNASQKRVASTLDAFQQAFVFRTSILPHHIAEHACEGILHHTPCKRRSLYAAICDLAADYPDLWPPSPQFLGFVKDSVNMALEARKRQRLMVNRRHELVFALMRCTMFVPP